MKTNFFIFFVLGLISIFFISSKTEKPLKYKGENYNYCDTEHDNKIDTIESPGGVTIIKSSTIVIYYDHFLCKPKTK